MRLLKLILLLFSITFTQTVFSQTESKQASQASVLQDVDQIIAEWTPADEADSDTAKQQLLQMQMETVFSLKRFRAEVSQENYLEAIQLIEHVRPPSRDIDDLANWEQAKLTLIEDLRKLNEAAQNKWAEEVAEYITYVKQLCLDAQNSQDLNTAFIRGSRLKLRQQTRGNAWGERNIHLLEGAIYTLQQFASYLDFRSAGKSDAANKQIEALINDKSHYPILDVQVAQKYLLESPANWTEEKLCEHIFRDFKRIDDIEITLNHISEISAEADERQLDSIETLLYQFQTTKTLIETKKYPEALNSATTRYPSSSSPTYLYYEILLDNTLQAIVTSMAEDWQLSTALPKDGSADLMIKNLAEALIRESKLTELLSLCEMLKTNRITKQTFSRWTGSIPVISLYLGAVTAEKADLPVDAYNKYLKVIEAGNCPTDLILEYATERIKAIREAHPEVDSDSNNQLTNEIERLQKENEALSRRLDSYKRQPGFNRP